MRIKYNTMIKNDETKSKVNKLVDSMIDDKLEETNIRPINPLNHLMNTTATFIQGRFEKIQKDSELENDVVAAIKEQVKNGNVNFNDLTTFLNQTRLRSSEAVESLLNFFKPSSGESNPLLSNPDRGSENSVFDNAKPEDLKAINKVIQLIETMKDSTDNSEG